MRRFIAGAVVLTACGLGGSADDDETDDGQVQGFEPPVVMNPESPVEYPPSLYEREISGTVLLRLFIDETGNVVPDSTRVAESSGQRLLDSAAVAGVASMQFAPARQDGEAVATLFLQPVHFRHPADSALGSRP